MVERTQSSNGSEYLRAQVGGERFGRAGNTGQEIKSGGLKRSNVPES